MKPTANDPTLDLPTHPEAKPAADAADRLWQGWRQGRRPDVDAFLARVGPLAPDQVAAALRVDQRERWQTGEPIAAENYLGRHPEVRADPEAAIDLIFNEFLLRERLGERPGLDEYLRRFPEYAAVLEPQIGLHRALGSASPTLSAGPAPSETTVPSPARPAPAPRPPRALVLGVPQTDQEVQSLLRRRLGFGALLVFGFFLLYAPVVLPVYFGGGNHPAIVLYGSIVAASGILGVLLRSSRPLSLGALRGIEGVLFGCVTLFCLWQNYDFFRWRLPAALAAHDRVGMIIAARHQGWVWVILIMVYGILIPNTWRRCAVVVGVMGLCPVVLNLTLGLLDGGIEPRLLVRFCFGIVVDVGLAVMIAVFGAHRLENLRSAAAEARKLGQYQLKQLLGAGGMGEVYLAEHRLLRRPCALKLIRPERAGDPTSLRRFEHEVQVTATLTHPNTIKIFDYGHAADGTFYYVMEYLPGPNLEQFVHRHGPLPPERAVHLLRQVCGSLTEAHAIGLIHRDIKPSNLIACQRGGRDDVAKLLDFGLATGHGLGGDGSKLTQEGAITGTPAYMSPEQAALRDAVDGRSDIYSLGAVAYFLLTGQPPFLRPTAVQTLAAHLGEAVVPPSRLRPGLPAGLEAVALKCLEKDPARRFPNAEALDQALAQCAGTAEPKSPSV
jgi:serine/threonine-protein kinase